MYPTHMCNLYAMTRKEDDLARFLRVSHNRCAAFQPVNAIFPRHTAPVVRHAADGERELVLLTWGFIRLQPGKAPKPVTNVRDDQIQTNPSGATHSRQRRCLVPASSFCEPNGDVKPATWHWFAINGTNAAAFCVSWYLAPLQRSNEEGRPQRRYRDLFVPDDHAQLAGGTINHERMPVLLTREDEFDTWLRGSPDEAFAVVREYPADQMRIVQEGSTGKTCSRSQHLKYDGG